MMEETAQARVVQGMEHGMDGQTSGCDHRAAEKLNGSVDEDEDEDELVPMAEKRNVEEEEARWARFGLMPIYKCNQELQENAANMMRLVFAMYNNNEDFFFSVVNSIPHFLWRFAMVMNNLAINIHWQTPLHLAVAMGSVNMIRELLKRGADPTSLTHNTYATASDPTILHCATLRTLVDKLKFLLEEGVCPVDLTGCDGKTSLHEAISVGSLEMVKLLLDHGADPRKTTASHRIMTAGLEALFPTVENHQWNSLMLAAADAQCEIVDLLLENHFHDGINMTTNNGATALHCAVRLCDSESLDSRRATLQLLLDHGADPNAQVTSNGCTPAHVILQDTSFTEDVRLNQVLDTLALLHHWKADFSIQDMCGRTPLHLAVASGFCQYVQALLTYGGRNEKRDRDGNTPLLLAALHGNSDTFDLLMQSESFDMNTHVNSWGHNLHHAAVLGLHVNPKGASIIMNCVNGQIDPKEVDKQGRTPNDYAHHVGFLNDLDITKYEQRESSKKDDPNIFDLIRSCPDYKPSENETYDPAVCSHYLLRLSEHRRLGKIHDDPKMCGHERCLVAKQVYDTVTSLLRCACEVDQRFKGELLRTGSIYEGFRLDAPDEFDLMYSLEELTSALTVRSSDVPGFVYVEVAEPMRSKYQDLIDDHNLLNAQKVKELMVRLVWEAANPETWSLLPGLHASCTKYHKNCAVCKPMVDYTCPGIQLQLIWIGQEYKWLAIDVDVIPTLKVEGWPEEAVKPQNVDCSFYYLVPKSETTNPLLWRLSFSHQEMQILRSLNYETQHACYAILKILKECYQTINTLHTYVMKSLLFQSLDQFKDESDWSPDQLALRVQHILQILLQTVSNEKESIPSYFLPNYHVTSDGRHQWKQAVTIGFFKSAIKSMLDDLELLGKGEMCWPVKMDAALESPVNYSDTDLQDFSNSHDVDDDYDDGLVLIDTDGVRLVVGTPTTLEDD